MQMLCWAVFVLQASCKSAVAFFQFSILANYFWLLVEGMYLQTLLALTFVFQKKYFWWYILIGWGESPPFFFSTTFLLAFAVMMGSLSLRLPGLPTTIITVWILTRNFYDNRGWAAQGFRTESKHTTQHIPSKGPHSSWQLFRFTAGIIEKITTNAPKQNLLYNFAF